MRHFLLTWLGTAIALLITAHFVPGFIVKTFVTALVAAIVLGLVNAIVRPILSILTLPITLITFGLFTFVINALTLWLASALTPGYGFEIRGFLPALLGSIVLAIVSTIINYLLRAID
jgi:putative membrane protein